jgi:Mu-like prophage major head subunit gpT
MSALRTRTATRWALREVSLVPLPADTGATIRSSTLDEIETAPAEAETLARAETNRQIRALATHAGLPAAWADGQIDNGATLLEARSAALGDMILARAAAPAIRTQHAAPSDGDDLQHRAEALQHRMAGTPVSDAARPYAHLRLFDHARDFLHRSGISTTGLSAEQVLTRAMHTTSDFAQLLTGAGNRTLAPPYQAALSPLRQLFRDSTAVDFRAKTRLALTEMPLLEKVNEAGEIKYGTRGETAESYSLATYARLFALSRQALVNDDLGAFSDWTQAMGAAAAETENSLRAALLAQGGGLGPVMADGKRLFHADHGNLADPLNSDGGALSVMGLSTARLALRRQVGLDGTTPIGAAPKYLLVGPELETTAEQVLAEIAAATPENANPFSGRLTLLVEPRLSGDGWYLFADPQVRPVFEQAHLASAPGPQMDSRSGWDVLGVEFRVVLDFGAGAIDWRGAYHDPGAA